MIIILMHLTDICTSLETSKKLQELGFRQPSIYYRCSIKGESDYRLSSCELYDDNIPAYTASELMDGLPYRVGKDSRELVITKIGDDYMVGYRMLKTATNTSLVESIASMHIYLIENNLYKLQKSEGKSEQE